jgi:transcription elongation factor Elf1
MSPQDRLAAMFPCPTCGKEEIVQPLKLADIKSRLEQGTEITLFCGTCGTRPASEKERETLAKVTADLAAGEKAE